MSRNNLAQAYTPPPPLQEAPTTAPKRSRKMLYAIIAIVILLVAVLVPVLFLFVLHGNAADASSLKFTETQILSASTGGDEQIYTIYIKNFNTPYVMSRAEGTYDGQQVIGITDGVNHKMWTYYDGQWQDTTFMSNGNWSTVDEGWNLLRTSLRNWSGSGELTYTLPTGDIFRLTNIEVNPSLSDSLFQKP
jgi:hypothetical protein